MESPLYTLVELQRHPVPITLLTTPHAAQLRVLDDGPFTVSPPLSC